MLEYVFNQFGALLCALERFRCESGGKRECPLEKPINYSTCHDVSCHKDRIIIPRETDFLPHETSFRNLIKKLFKYRLITRASLLPFNIFEQLTEL